MSFYSLIRCGYTPLPPRHQIVLFSGSAVPSQCHYMDWQACGNGYDMVKGRPEDFEAFLKLGYCKDAMSHYTHRVEFSEEQLSLTRVNFL